MGFKNSEILISSHCGYKLLFKVLKMELMAIIHSVSIDENIVHCSVAKSCLTLCDPMDCSTPGPSVLHCLPEFAQIHVH